MQQGVGMSTANILQPGVGPIRSAVYLPADADSIFWGRLPCGMDAARIIVEPGTEVTIDTLSHEGVLEDQGRDPAVFFAGFGVERDAVLDDAVRLASSDHPRDPTIDGPHVVTGPIGVRGAQPGDLLKITVVELLPRVPYGVISNRHGRGALPGEYPREPGTVSIFAAVEDRGAGPVGTMPRVAGGAHTVNFALAPFLGIMGVAVAGATRPHSVPPGTHGGNIDINLLTEGSVLYLPVQVADALAYIGDPHFAQGDGEVSLTAMEASLRATLRFDVIPQAEAIEAFGMLVGPLAETTEFLVPTGMNADLDTAVQECVRAAIALLQARFGMDAEHAYAYLSAATDFNISQVVDLVKGVHARIRVEDFNVK
jgi:acetamidase/formamidase